ncbi:hypothetical protein GGX14DRAFT_397249 [Mycena pura]|uniref:Uncharacterized protein n=1 Tax=Mycena pura TaxID=153505 RepID=A0AAD6V8P4_9AGAR|nr:hypothetical protein GGX14DRAFT_397249 [Mycena pura]
MYDTVEKKAMGCCVAYGAQWGRVKFAGPMGAHSCPTANVQRLWTDFATLLRRPSDLQARTAEARPGRSVTELQESNPDKHTPSSSASHPWHRAFSLFVTTSVASQRPARGD